MMLSHPPFEILREEFLATLKQAEDKLRSGEEASELLKQCGSLHSKMGAEAKSVSDDSLKKMLVQITKGYKIQLKSFNSKNDRIATGIDETKISTRIAERVAGSQSGSHRSESYTSPEHDDKGLLRENGARRHRRSKATKQKQRSKNDRFEKKSNEPRTDNPTQDTANTTGLASRAKGILSTVWGR